MNKSAQSKLTIAIYVLGVSCTIASAFWNMLLGPVIMLILVLPYITLKLDEEIKYRLCIAILAAGILSLIGSLFQEMLMVPLGCFLMCSLPLILLRMDEERKIRRLCMTVFSVGAVCLIASLFRNHLLLPAFMGLIYVPLKFEDMSDKRLSGWRIASFILGVLCLIAALWWKVPFVGYLGIFCIVFMIVRLLMPDTDQYTLIPKIAMIAMVLAVAMPVARKMEKMISQSACRVNMVYGIQNAFINYDDGTYPSPDKWCDLLIENCDVGLKVFICPASKAVEGECTYALNRHIYECEPNQLPPDMVFLFETEAGKEDGPGTGSLRDRDFYQVLQTQDPAAVNDVKDSRIYPKRWNQIGGPEIATAAYHGKCHVLLVNGKIVEVKKEDIPTLRWTAIEPNQIYPQ